MLGQSPPTTSGIVVLSGSNNFGTGSDFPTRLLTVDYHIEDQRFSLPVDLASSATASLPVVPVIRLVDLYTQEKILSSPLGILTAPATAHVLSVDATVEDNRVQTFLQFVPFGDNSKITSTPVTTSGIVILDFYPGVGAGAAPPYIPPIFLNERIFPVTFSGLGERVFPEKNRRIYPVLPQFSIITPGD